MRKISSCSSHSDQDLVQLCVAGDPLAWDSLILRYVKLIYSIAKDFGFQESDCRDVVQNVCLTLYKSLHSVRDGGKVYSWLMTTTRRECLALIAQRVRDRIPEGETDEPSDEPPDEPSDEPADPAGMLEEIMLSAEKQQVLREVLDKWGNSRCRLLIKMLYFEERSYKETAALLHVSHEGMGPRSARCLDKLRSMISERGITSL
jgi:RNA polymerase sigma factor (sigma-70 family)